MANMYPPVGPGQMGIGQQAQGAQDNDSDADKDVDNDDDFKRAPEIKTTKGSGSCKLICCGCFCCISICGLLAALIILVILPLFSKPSYEVDWKVIGTGQCK